jgi:hypothetical protein
MGISAISSLSLDVGELTPLERGGYSEVFKTPRGTVYKVFLTASAAGSGPPDETRREVFEAEVAAYKIAMGQPLIRGLVARFVRTVPFDAVTAQGSPISDRYLAGCCYEVEFLQGPIEKLAPIDDPPAHIEAVVRKMEAFGIHYTLDASCEHRDAPERIRLIDFATHDPAGGLRSTLAMLLATRD